MKKIIAILLVVVLCVSLVACSTNKAESGQSNDEKTTEFVIDAEGHVDFTDEQLVNYIERVDLTLDNWDLYFEDYCRETKKEIVNSFGEVSYYNEHNCDFGLKEGIIASFHNVAFKFSGVEACEKHYSTWISDEEANKEQLIDFGNSTHSYNPCKHYTKYECIDVVGELYIYHFPDEIKGFTINGEPKADWYLDTWETPEGDYIAEIYNKYHQ